MFRSVAILLLVSSFALAQASAPKQTPSPAAAPPSPPAGNASPAAKPDEAKPAEKEPGANLPPETAVITIKHLCGAPPASTAASKAAAEGTAAKPAGAAGNCNTVITKAEFEKIVNAVVPKNRRTELPPTAKQ